VTERTSTRQHGVTTHKIVLILGDDHCSMSNILVFCNGVGLNRSIWQILFYAILNFLTFHIFSAVPEKWVCLLYLYCFNSSVMCPSTLFNIPSIYSNFTVVSSAHY
jgi:hypothetical protein